MQKGELNNNSFSTVQYIDRNFNYNGTYIRW